MPPKRKSATTPTARVATRASTRSSARMQKTPPTAPPPEEEPSKIVQLSPEAADNPSQQATSPPTLSPPSEQPDVAICEIPPQPKQTEDVSSLAQHGRGEAEPMEVEKPQTEPFGGAQEVVLETVVVETKMEILVEGNEGGHYMGSVNQDEGERKEGTSESQQGEEGTRKVQQVQAQAQAQDENKEREENQGEVGNGEEEVERGGIEDVEVETEGRTGKVSVQESDADVEAEIQGGGGCKEATQVQGEVEKKEAEEIEGGVGNTEVEELHEEDEHEEAYKVKAEGRNEEEKEEETNERERGNGEVGVEERAEGEEAVEVDGGHGEEDGGEEAGFSEAGGRGTGGEGAVEGEGGHGEEDGEEEVDDAEAGEGEEGREADEAPVPMEERKKQKEYEIFIGGLDKDVVEDDLRKVFSEVGEVVEVRLVKKSQSQKNKGFAFVRFATVEQAKRATTELKSLKINGKVCGVTRNNDNETLYLRNICKTWTTSDLLEKLKSYEIENLVDAHLIDDPDNKGKNRGYAFLEFCTHMDAVSACTKLQKRGISFGTDSPAEVAFAKSAVQPDEEVMAQVKSVFLDGLSANWDEEYVKEQLKKYGEIEKVELSRDMPTAKRKDFAFVCFTTRDAALACIDGVNKDGICNDGEKVMVKASLRKPLQNRKPSARVGWKGFTRGQEGQRRSYAPARSSGYGGRGHYYTGDGGYRKELHSSSGRPSSWQGRDFERRAPSYPYGGGRSRPRYAEENRPERYTSGRREEYPAPYSGFSSQRRYPENAYGPQYQHYESSMPSGHSYPPLSGSKRPYSNVSEEAFYGRRNRGRADTGVEPVQPQGSMSYGSYPRIVPEDHQGYGSATQSYGNQYLSGSGDSRTYY